MSDNGDRWRIKEFSAIVGVQEATLRAWERRYGLLRPERTSGGFRLYTPADERRIAAMRTHLERGLAAAQAARLALREIDDDRPSQPQALVDAMVGAAQAFDAPRLEALLDAAFALGRAAAIRDVVLPVLREVGRRWERDVLTVGQEHYASHVIERRLLTLAAGWNAGTGPLAVLACPPGERHALALLCFGLALADLGWRICYLGEDTPVGEIAATSSSLAADAVVLCSIDAACFSQVADEIAALGRSHPTLIAGRGASAQLAARLGVEHAAGDPVSTAAALASRLADL